MLEILQIVVSTLVTFVLSIFGFSWDAPEEEGGESTVDIAIVRLESSNFDPIPVLARETAQGQFMLQRTSCDGIKPELLTVEIPSKISKTAKPYIS